MEDVLEVYKRPYDPKRPVVCLDETSKQLIGEVQTPMLALPGHVAHYDYEYVRNGVANLFMICEPLAGKRDVEVTDRRTKKDYAQCLRKIADEMYPDAEVIVLVQDNLKRQFTLWLIFFFCLCLQVPVMSSRELNGELWRWLM